MDNTYVQRRVGIQAINSRAGLAVRLGQCAAEIIVLDARSSVPLGLHRPLALAVSREVLVQVDEEGGREDKEDSRYHKRGDQRDSSFSDSATSQSRAVS